MTFLQPLLLCGLLAVALPVLIHIFSKPQLKRVRWAANRFLLASIQKNSRKMLVEDWLLLLLRCLLIIILILLFARPALLTSTTELSFSREPVTAVVVLDQSASMGQSDGTRTRFEQAKTMAAEVISKLAPGSSCALFLASDEVREVIAKPTADFALFRRVLDQIPATDRRSNLYPAIESAVKLLKASPGNRKELFILTDSQLPAWKDLENIRRVEREIKAEVGFHLLVIGARGEDNLAVSSMALSETISAVNQPLQCSVSVTNWGAKAVEKIVVKLALDDEPPQSEVLIGRIEPGASQTVSLSVRPRNPGYHSLTATIPGDRLPSDNQRSLAVLVLDQVRALLIEGTDNSDPAKRDAFFLGHALCPVRSDEMDRYFMKVTRGNLKQLESSTIRQYEMIFLCNVGQLTPLGAQNLRQYVEQGGTLIVFPGPATDVAYYNTNRDLSVLLPVRIGPPRDVEKEPGKSLTWQAKDYQHPLVTFWNQSESGTLGSVRFFRYFPFTMPLAETASASQVVLKYNNGEPAVAARKSGKGHVFLFGSTATTQWNTLPLHSGFVPLLRRLTALAVGDTAGALNIPAGQIFRSEIASEYAGKDVYSQRLGDKKKSIVGKVEQGESTSWLQYRTTDLAGAYRIFVGDESKPYVVFAVQSDPDESNLTQIRAAEIDPLIASEKNSESGKTGSNSASPQKIPGKELWWPLAITLLVMAVIETGLGHWFSQSK